MFFSLSLSCNLFVLIFNLCNQVVVIIETVCVGQTLSEKDTFGLVAQKPGGLTSCVHWLVSVHIIL